MSGHRKLDTAEGLFLSGSVIRYQEERGADIWEGDETPASWKEWTGDIMEGMKYSKSSFEVFILPKEYLT